MNVKEIAIQLARTDVALIRAGIGQEQRQRVLDELGQEIVRSELKAYQEMMTPKESNVTLLRP